MCYQTRVLKRLNTFFASKNILINLFIFYRKFDVYRQLLYILYKLEIYTYIQHYSRLCCDNILKLLQPYARNFSYRQYSHTYTHISIRFDYIFYNANTNFEHPFLYLCKHSHILPRIGNIKSKKINEQKYKALVTLDELVFP